MTKNVLVWSASMSETEAQSFYSSTEWAMKIDSTLNSYPTIPLPSQPNHSTHNHSSALITVPVSHTNSSPCVLTPLLSFHITMLM